MADETEISLRDREAVSGFDERRARHDLRRQLILPLNWIFIGLNVMTILILVVIGYAEWQAVAAGRDIERLVTTEVIMTVVGATTVQLGALMFTVMKALFSEA